MKKLFAIIAVALCVVTASAQRASDMGIFSNNEYEDWNHSAVFVETAIGAIVGDVDTDFGWNVGLGYRWHISYGFCWDVLKLGINTIPSNFSKETLDWRVLSGFRYNSPRFIAGKSLYANVAFGYHILDGGKDGKHGLAYEIGAGINLTRHLSLGISWDASSYNSTYTYKKNSYSENISWGIVGLKLGCQF
jgi:opacity protein-like surface antigen